MEATMTAKAASRRHTLWIAAALLVLLSVLAVFLMLPRGRADAQAVQAANALVESGHTAEAIQIYEGLLAGGVHDSAVFYNLGNAYYAQGDPVRAAAAFQQAAALSPRDDDIRANLEIALAAAPGATLPEPGGPLGFLSALTDGWLSLDEAALLALALWVAVCLLWLAGRKGGRWPRRLMAVAGVALVVIGLSFAARAVLAQTADGLPLAGIVAALFTPNL